MLIFGKLRNASADGNSFHSGCQAGFFVYGKNSAVHVAVAGGQIKAHRHFHHAPADHQLGLHAQHRLDRPGHAEIRQKARPGGKDPRVSRLDMRMRAEHRRHAPVQIVAKRALFAGGLRVEIHQDDLRQIRRFQEPVHRGERAV